MHPRKFQIPQLVSKLRKHGILKNILTTKDYAFKNPFHGVRGLTIYSTQIVTNKRQIRCLPFLLRKKSKHEFVIKNYLIVKLPYSGKMTISLNLC
jgi:hypothetical protein